MGKVRSWLLWGRCLLTRPSLLKLNCKQLPVTQLPSSQKKSRHRHCYEERNGGSDPSHGSAVWLISSGCLSLSVQSPGTFHHQHTTTVKWCLPGMGTTSNQEHPNEWCRWTWTCRGKFGIDSGRSWSSRGMCTIPNSNNNCHSNSTQTCYPCFTYITFILTLLGKCYLHSKEEVTKT